MDLYWNPEFLLAALAPGSHSVADLTVEGVHSFNSMSTLPQAMTVFGRTNGIRYTAHSGDANLNSSVNSGGWGTIECPAECQPDWPSYAAPGLYHTMQFFSRVTMRQGSSGRWMFNSVWWGRPYPLNDFIVTVDSAQYPRFSPALGSDANGPIPWKKNHTTIGDGDVGVKVWGTKSLQMQKELQQ